jgi:hypothetical protein
MGYCCRIFTPAQPVYPIATEGFCLRCSHIGEKIKQRLGFSIDPVQVFEDQEKRAIEALAMNQAPDRVASATPPDRGIHLVEWTFTVVHAEQSEQVRHRLLEGAVESEHSSGDFFTLRTFVVLIVDPEIAFQQLDDRQIGGGASVRDGKGLHHESIVLRHCLEFVKQARFANARFRHDRDDLSMAIARKCKGALELFQLLMAAHEPRQSALSRHLKARPQCAQAQHLVDVYRLAHALDARRAERLEVEITLRQLPCCLGNRDRAGGGEGLHARRQAR